MVGIYCKPPWTGAIFVFYSAKVSWRRSVSGWSSSASRLADRVNRRGGSRRRHGGSYARGADLPVAPCGWRRVVVSEARFSALCAASPDQDDECAEHERR